MRVEKKSICVLCGKNEATTKEHIPPKGIFLKPLPNNLITVPACNSCNNNSSEDDELFKMLLAISVGSSTESWKDLWKNAMRTFQHRGKGKLRNLIRSRVAKVSVHTPAGLYLGEAPTIKFQAKEIKPVIKKITKGLFFKIGVAEDAENSSIGFYQFYNTLFVTR